MKMEEGNRKSHLPTEMAGSVPISPIRGVWLMAYRNHRNSCWVQKSGLGLHLGMGQSKMP
jgi:hypothetical protein